MKTIDARGYSCPVPVIMVQKEVAAAEPAELEILVDEKCAVENVTRFAENKGYQVTASDLDGDYKIVLKK